MAKAKPGPKPKAGARYPSGDLKPDPRPTPEQQEMRRKRFGAPQANGELLYDPLNGIAWLTSAQRTALEYFRRDADAYRGILPDVARRMKSHLADFMPRHGGVGKDDDEIARIQSKFQAALYAIDRWSDSAIRRAVTNVCIDYQPATACGRKDGNDLLREGADRLIKFYHIDAAPVAMVLRPDRSEYDTSGGTHDLG